MSSRTAQIPFNFEITSDNINENCEIDTNIDIKKTRHPKKSLFLGAFFYHFFIKI